MHIKLRRVDDGHDANDPRRIAVDEAHELEMALSTAGDAVRAVDLQAYRLRHPDLSSGAFSDIGFRNQTEARFLIVALRWLHRACALVADLTRDADLLSTVDATWESMGIKHASDMRDIWEHFDEYIVGSGRLQRPGRRPEGVAGPASLGVYIWTGGPDTLGSLTWAGLSLSLDGAVVAAHRLYWHATSAANDWRAVAPPSSSGGLDASGAVTGSEIGPGDARTSRGHGTGGMNSHARPA